MGEKGKESGSRGWVTRMGLRGLGRLSKSLNGKCFTQGWVDFTALGVQGTRRQGKQSIKHSIETLIPFFLQ